MIQIYKKVNHKYKFINKNRHQDNQFIITKIILKIQMQLFKIYHYLNKTKKIHNQIFFKN
jgi:hypothetical protein